MRRRFLMGAAAVVLLAAGYAGLHLYRFLRIDTVKIDDGFYVLLGGGGNTAVLIGDSGIIVVDTKFSAPGRRLPALIRSISDKPVAAIINTHYHQDHTHGNPNFAAGTPVIAHRRTRAHLIQRDKSFWEFEPNWSALPRDLVDAEREFAFGDETVRIIHPGPGHTDGDLVVHFTRRRIVHTGDLFVNGLYPFIDRRAGGSARQWLSTLDRILAIPDVAHYIPGHGPLSSRADVERFRGYLHSLVSQVEAGVARGEPLSAIQNRIDLDAYDELRGLPFLTSRARNLRWVYEELAAQQRAGE